MGRLADVQLHIERESESHKVDATMYAVEKGEPFTDHVAKRPSEFSLSGYILSDNFNADLEKLKTLMNKGELVQYIGKMSASDVIIMDIQGEHGQEIRNGVSLRINLRKIRITKTAWVLANPKEKPTRKPVTQSGKKQPVQKKPPVSSAVYHVIKKGDTYWGLSIKYGTSIQQLRAWNGWEDRKIPIGAKARVK